MSTSHHREDQWTKCRIRQALSQFISWINEVAVMSLGPNNKHSRSYTIHFEASLKTLQVLWDKVKNMAAIYDAATICASQGSHPFSENSDLAMIFEDDHNAQANPGLLPHAVRHILGDNTSIRIPCLLGTTADFEEECKGTLSLLGGRPKAEWEACYERILEGFLEDPEVDFKAVLSKYADYPGERNA
jgi:hypothetical protein